MNRNCCKKLSIMIALWLASAPYAFASTTETITYNDKSVVELNLLESGDEVTITVPPTAAEPNPKAETVVKAPEFTIDNATKNGILSGVHYWTDMLGPGMKNSHPWQIYVTTKDNYNNASAYTTSFDGETGYQSDANYVQQFLQGDLELGTMQQNLVLDGTSKEHFGFSEITIGRYFGAIRSGSVNGYMMDGDTILPTNEQAVDFVGTFRHEMGHALGIFAATQYIDDKGNPTEKIYVTDDGERLIQFSGDVTDVDSWNAHLYDQNGNHAKAGMEIITTDEFNKKLAADSSLKKSDFFIVDNAALNAASLSGTQGKLYFKGENVSDALAGATFDGISGIPVQGWEEKQEGNQKYYFEGSHLQTTGMMSHRTYSNYTAFMEAELAVMQDLGYTIDREAYFGHSVYGNNGIINNTNCYFARNEDGTAYLQDVYSTVPLGIGLHIYGSGNTVTQSGNILTAGTGAVGVRIDGIKNTLVIPEDTSIRADGTNGKGVLVAYGRDQSIVHNGTVTATGNSGNAFEFNFGSSSNGATDEYRGSYIRYIRSVDTDLGIISSANNYSITSMDQFTYNVQADELNGPLISKFDINGTMSGSANAVYIGRNAFVQNINVLDNAVINGDITSDWKHFNTDGSYDGSTTDSDINTLSIQYGGSNYEYDVYIPELVTKLNFNMENDKEYNGNITGADNLKVNVNKGCLVYGGTADVVNVQVAKDAALLGGEYTVNSMTDKLPVDLYDTTTGQFINHGTIGAKAADSNMVINGTLNSDGIINAFGGGEKGTIQVNGTANIEGSTVSLLNMLPGENAAVLSATTLNGNITNPAGTPFAATGMLNSEGTIDGNDISVSVSAANNLGDISDQQLDTYNAMRDMLQSLSGDSRRDEMRSLYSLNPSDAKAALSAIGENGGLQMTAIAQQSTMVNRVISDRMSVAFATKPVHVAIPVSNLTDGGKEPEVEMKLAVPQENNIWVKMTKNWGDLSAGSNYHAAGITGGYDRQVSPYWRAGGFISYNAISCASDNSRGNIFDYRVGVYGGFNKGAAEGFLYLDYGHMRNSLNRSISALGLGASANYNSRVIELGGEYKYDFHANDNKIWHVSPYGNVQLSWLHQDGYSEAGAGIYNQLVSGKNNTYLAGQLGVEFKRYLAEGSYGIRFGVKHAFSGYNPDLAFRYSGNDGKEYILSNELDRTHMICALEGEMEIGNGWFINGEAQVQKGAHDKDIYAALQLKRVW
ncbi:MAG: autotransporter domain-containing protein [Anaerovibrio sp.]|uniref:autotransporter outer membrane beta-barrel domain-containing protein n=1 Tax=Anaerovibrio sp. TaxID=1872532 RepID=UPI0025F30705|nr:autotransporter outer membrane beta-barrel domain-containing protein [Anaerovibrio sp.]MCR5176894.1 autotransporter domain-containing protein [Anaerovibrio sp.]